MTADPIRILVVDDRPENLVALEAMLRTEGVEICRAGSGPDALELLLIHDFALALLDVHMPGMDGFELAELMRGTARTRQVPIVFVTANPDEPQRVFQGYDAGAVDFLVKPLEPRILRNKVRTFVELYEQKRQLSRQLTELEQVSAQLAETLRLNETFVAAVGHDLRSPLAAITTGIMLLQRKSLPEDCQRVVGRVGNSARRLASIIDHLNDLARVRLGSGLQVDRRPVDLAPIVREVVRELVLTQPDRQVVIEEHGATTGEWDEVRLSRVASNLIGNALQYGDASAPVRVTLDGAAPDRVRLAVWNAGAVPEALLGSIFEPFRGGETRRSSGSLGLGLYIVQEIARAHGGTVAVSSTAAAGTRFEVELPRAAPRA